MELLQTNNWLFCCITTQTEKKPFVSSLPQCRKEAFVKVCHLFSFFYKRERNVVFLNIVGEKRPTIFRQQLLDNKVSLFPQNLSLSRVQVFFQVDKHSFISSTILNTF